MARYLGQTEHPVITKSIIDIVDDAVGFMKSESCRKWFIEPHAPARQWRHVKLFSHRRCGFSTAALKLFQKYKPSLIITHSRNSCVDLRIQAMEKKIEGDIHNNIMPITLIDNSWMKGYDMRYKLIIIDCASMIEAKQNNGTRASIPGMDEFRDKCLHFCDLLVELG